MHQEAVSWSNISASKQFELTLGGRFLFIASATWGGGSAKIQALSQDGSTYVDIFGAFDATDAEQNVAINTLTANGALVLDLPPGSYQLTIATASAVYASVARVPLC